MSDSQSTQQFRQAPLGLQATRFYMAIDSQSPDPVPGKPWVALVCDPNDERFFKCDFCRDEPGADDFERLLSLIFRQYEARAEHVEVCDPDVAIDLTPFCRDLKIRIDVKDQLETAERVEQKLRDGIVVPAARRDGGSNGDAAA